MYADLLVIGRSEDWEMEIPLYAFQGSSAGISIEVFH